MREMSEYDGVQYTKEQCDQITSEFFNPILSCFICKRRSSSTGLNNTATDFRRCNRKLLISYWFAT